MNRFLLCVFLLSILSFSTIRAQNHYTIKGNLSDTLNKAPLQNASVILLRAKDSILVCFTRADSNGSFNLHPDTLGRYILMVSFPGFADYIDRIQVKDNHAITLGNLPMVSSTHLLQEFVMKKKVSAMQIKGDTTEYNADSFTVRNGATVDELLKKLPGLQIDKDGKIMAQGEQVQKVLVDGEEFFSDDPAVVTKSLQAAIVDKVQVYDKKSDEAAFTGIDDGQKTKTINLTLKEDKKRGVFGKAVAGAGPTLSDGTKGGFFENEGMINAFKGKRQLSAFGIMSNTGTIGLNWQDRGKYASSNDRTYDEESGIMYFNSADDEELAGGWNGTYSGEGLPTVWTGGLHYADKWNQDHQHITANYRYSKNNIEVEGNTITQYILPDSGFVRKDTRNTFSTAQRHGVDGLYEWTIDTNSNLKFTVNGNYVERSSSGTYTTKTVGTTGAAINNSARSTSSNSNSKSLDADLSYRKKFKKKGRNMSIEIKETYKETAGTGYLSSGTDYYTDGLYASSDSVNQRKNNSSGIFGINARLSYTEPLSKIAFLTFRYGLSLSNSRAEKLSFNRGPSDWETNPDSLYSSSYDYNTLTHNGSAVLRFVIKKYNFSVGGDVFSTNWQQHDRLLNTTQDRSYVNYSPSANLKYSFNKQANLNFNYNGYTRQPTLDQLQPLHQNTDPLNQSIGNPDLRQEFVNNMNLSYHSYKPISSVYTYVGVGATMTKDDISRSDSLDNQGRHTYKYINVNGNYNGFGYGGYGWKIKPIALDIQVNTNVNYSHTNSYVNSVKNTSDNNRYTLGIDLNKDWKKKDKTIAGFNFGPSVTYNNNQSSISSFTTSYWSSEVTGEGYAEIFLKMRITTAVWYFLRQETPIFPTNNNVLRWDASLSRKFLKGDQLELKAGVYDILNQNIGYSRTAANNTIIENNYNTIRRHGLIKLTWQFTKGPDAKKTTDDDE